MGGEGEGGPDFSPLATVAFRKPPRATELSLGFVKAQPELGHSLAFAPLRRVFLRVVELPNFHCQPEDGCEPRMQRGNNDHARTNSEQGDKSHCQSRKVIGVLYCLCGDIRLCSELS